MPRRALKAGSSSPEATVIMKRLNTRYLVVASMSPRVDETLGIRLHDAQNAMITHKM